MKIGILGGGQLGRMFIQEAIKYDDDFFVLDPNPDCSCAGISEYTQGDFNNYQDVLDFGKDKDVLSIEIEHVNVKALKELKAQGIKIIPDPEVIEMIQQKILQKEFYKAHQIPSPDFLIRRNTNEIPDFPLPFVQKLSTGGYDGRGVQVIRTEEDLKNLWPEDSVIEALVDIDKELSIIVARNEAGETKVFPITEMVADPRLNLLDFNICPAEISKDVEAQAQEIAGKFIKSIDAAGLFAIELFLDRSGKVWVNETAPRLHNSGHQSQEGNSNSQFEQFYRVLKNYPLADTEAQGFSGMLNLIGAEGFSGPVHYHGLEEALKLPQTYVHLYGKKETRPGRKMGHINVLANDRESLMEKLIHVKSLVTVGS